MGAKTKQTAVKRSAARTLAAAGDADAESGGVSGFVVIRIGSEEFRLEGKIGKNILVKYVAPSWEEAPSIGTIDEIANDVADALGLANSDFAENLKAFRNTLNNTPFGSVVQVFTENPIKISRIEIDTKAKKYAFGFGLDLVNKTVSVGNIKVQSFGLLFQYP